MIVNESGGGQSYCCYDNILVSTSKKHLIDEADSTLRHESESTKETDYKKALRKLKTDGYTDNHDLEPLGNSISISLHQIPIKDHKPGQKLTS